jgi:type IV fimbrial biogenesis protein FimT
MLEGQESADVLMDATRLNAAARAPQSAGRCAARGFTLIELIVTITLTGILVALSLPSFTAWIRNSQVRTTAEAVQSALRTGLAEAVRRNRLVVLSFTNSAPVLDATAAAGGKNWSLQAVPQFGESTESAASAVEKRFIGGGTLSDVGSAVVIADHAGAGISAVCFNSSGRVTVPTVAIGITGATCSPAPVAFDITQNNADRPLRVILQVGGQLRMCDPNRPTLSSTSPDGCPSP